MHNSNIVTQLIGLFTTFFVFILWSFHRRIDSESEKLFVCAVIVALISELLDVGVQLCPSIIVVNGVELVSVILRLYLVSIPLCVLLITLFANYSILDTKKFVIFRRMIIVFSIVNSLIILFLPSDFAMAVECRMPIGFATNYTYIQCAVISALILVELFVFRKKLNRATFIANLVWLLLFMVGGISQYLTLQNFGIPVVSFIISLGTVTEYLVLENPGNKYDYQNYRFHYETFVKYIGEKIKFKELQAILYINATTRNEEKMYSVNEVFTKLIMENKDNPEIRIFKGISNELILTSKELVLLQDIAASIYGIISGVEQKNSIDIYASIAIIPSIEKINNYRILRDILDEYRIKGNSVNENVRFFTAKDRVIERCNNDAIISSDIDYAIKNKTINIKFQALNSFVGDNKKIYEIITTLNNENNRELFPNEYSSVANKTNRFLQIDECSFEKVCLVLDSVLSRANKLGYILIRISVQALEEDSFLDRIVELLRRHDIPYKYICFEVTNADAILKKDVLLKNITYMQRLGISFAMGGFGSGESNLNYFIDLPMNIVKFDQSILKNAITDPKAALIMKDVTDLAHTLGFKVIAVGAKSEAEVRFIKSCGVEMAIGDQFADILDEKEFIKEMSLNGAQG